MKKLVRDEKGAALILALILLLIGGLISAALLGHMGSGILAGEVYEKRTAELYAADAGVEDAVWKIQHQVDEVKALTQCYQDWTYNMIDAEGGVAEVNDKRVEVTITLLTVEDDLPCDYRIVSTASGDGSGTRIEAYIAGTITYCSMLDHLITIQENLDEHEVELLEKDLEKLNITCPTGCTECAVCGKAYDYNSDAYASIPQECKGCIAVYNLPAAGWPTVSDLSARYWQDVESATHYYEDTEIDLEGNNVELEPLYVDGELVIKNSNSNNATLILTGTLYITSNTTICYGTSQNREMTLDLNGQTIFVASESTGDGKEALKIGDKCTIMGPGCIIAVGDIYFKPNAAAGANVEPAFVLSVMGTTRVQPNIDFLGAIAGKVDVDVQSGKPIVNYPAGGFGPVNFPSLFEANRSYGIYSWEVSQL